MQRVVVVAALFALVGCPSAPPPSDINNDPNQNNNANKTCTAGTATIPEPSKTDVPKRKDGKAIDTHCVGHPDSITGTSTTATVEGCIKIFGIGQEALPGTTVSIFDNAQDPQKDTPTYGSTTIKTQADSTAGLDCAGADAHNAACLALACDSGGAYSLDNVALHVPVIIRVSKAGDTSVVDSYSYDELFDGPNQIAPDDGGFVSYDANLIYDNTYSSIQLLAGQQITGGSTIDGVGRGAIAGEVRDCQDVQIQGATVTTDTMDAQTKVAYFDGSANPSPLPGATATANDGLFAVLNANTDPGKDAQTVFAGMLDPTCAGQDACQCVSLGSRKVRVFPDSVTIVTFRGDLPTP